MDSAAIENKTNAVDSGDSTTIAKQGEPTETVPKHPLHCSWTLWFYKSSNKSANWGDNMKPVFTFQNVEDFWALYNHIVPPSGLGSGCDYNLFREGIKPMWEDSKNEQGGKWVLNLPLSAKSVPSRAGPLPDPNSLDGYWLELLLLLIGEGFEEPFADDVCGAVVQLRPRQNRVNLWVGQASNKESVMSLGRTLQERLGLRSGSATLTFEPHQKEKSHLKMELTPDAK